MPITAEYDWEDGEDVIVVVVPLRGAKPSADHVFIADEYVKVNSAPYFLELDLHGQILAADSRAVFSRSGLRLHLHKATPGAWEFLVTDLPKKEKVARREASVDARYQELRNEKADKKKERLADDKAALHNHFDMEDSRKRWVEEKKDAELESQQVDLEDWQRKEEIAAAMLRDEDVEIAPGSEAPVNGTHPRRRRKKKTQDELFNAPNLPPPRAAKPVTITFTHTTRPTPARADNKDAVGPNDAPRSKPVLKRVHNPDAVDIGDQNPVWLKDRGDQYFSRGDFVSAVNAYTAAISLDDDEYVATIAERVATYYSNRAACYFQMSKYRKCVNDCDRALELMEMKKGPTPSQKVIKTLCKLCARRAAAFGYLGEVEEARRDYHQAIAHATPEMVEQLTSDMQRLDAIEVKQEADAAVKSGAFEKALKLYSDAREIDSTNATLWSNAALCCFALHDHAGCVDACTHALEIMAKTSGDIQKQTAKTHMRRAASLLELKRLTEALEDFEKASALMPGDKAVQADVTKVRARVKRQQADVNYKAGELELAEEVYGQALELDKADIKARGNRTACLLKLCRYQEVVTEATSILEAQELEGNMKAKVTALVRRGAAYAKLGNYREGVRDYSDSLELKEDAKVRMDMEAMITHFDAQNEANE